MTTLCTLKKKTSDAGFTMVEVIVAVTILAFATFGLIGMLQFSDQMSYRAKVNTKVAQILSAHIEQFSGMPFVEYKNIAASNFGVSTFQRGYFGSTPNSPGWPFFLNDDAFAEGLSIGAIDSATMGNTKYYLVYGKPLPPSTALRGLFPYVETVTLTFNQTSRAAPYTGTVTPYTSADSVTVDYKMQWIDQFNGVTNSISYTFNRDDPNQF
jgi:prepilin-type N-terminal cleavage/methylation domain-containing protein